MELRGEEPRRAVVTMEMMILDSFWVPQLHGMDYLNKPPLYNWVLMIFFGLTGDFSEWSVRLPGIFFLLLTAAAIFVTVRQQLGVVNALFAAAFFITFVELLFYGSVLAGEIDPFFTLLTFIQMLAIYFAFQSKSFFGFLLLSYILAGLGFLTKGFPSLFHQGVTLVCYALYLRKFRWLFTWQNLFGALACLLIIGGYFYKYHLEGGDALRFLLNLSKESSRKSFLVSNIGQIVLHLLVFPFHLLVLLLPWSLLLPLAFWKKQSLQHLKKDPLITFCLLFIFFNVLIYWVSPKTRNPYLYIFFPFAAIIFAKMMEVLYGHLLKVIGWILIGLGGLKLLYSVLIIPIQQDHFIFRKEMEKVLAITQQEPIYYTNWYNSYTVELGLSGFGSLKSDVAVPIFIHYTIPYYLTRTNNHIFQFEPNPEPGKFYLGYHWFMDNHPVEVYYRFKVPNEDKEYLLVKYKERVKITE